MTDEQKLSPEMKATWLAALRSGRYQQGVGLLKDGRTSQMCCLGVLCDLIRPDGWSREGDAWRWRESDLDAGHTQYLPLKLRVRLGFEEPSESASVEGQLACRNDGVCGHPKHSFAEIADWIEVNL